MLTDRHDKIMYIDEHLMYFYYYILLLSIDTPQSDKWLMSIFWRMCGVEMHFDSNIGKCLSSLGNALTAFAGDVDVADLSSVAEEDSCDPFAEEHGDTYDETDASTMPARLGKSADRSSSGNRPYSIERQLWRQTKIVSELRYCIDFYTSILYLILQTHGEVYRPNYYHNSCL